MKISHPLALQILDYEVDSDEEWEIPEGDDCDESTMSEEEEVVFSDLNNC